MWTNFEQSPVEDETISNAFSSRGMFRISSEKAVYAQPQVQASVQNQKMVIAIDKSLFLLDDEMVAKCSFLGFNAEIDALAISESGKLIVCGLGNGEVHGIFIKGVPLFNVCLKVEDVSPSGRTFVSVQQLEGFFYLICSNGSVYSMNGINETLLESYANNVTASTENIETVANSDEAIVGDITIQRITTARSLGELSAAVLIAQPGADWGGGADLLLIAGSQRFVYFKRISGSTASKIPFCEAYNGVKRIFNLNYNILALTHSGEIVELCPYTRTISLSHVLIKNALTINEMIAMECSKENIELLVLTKEKYVDGSLMHIIEYPSFQCKSQVQISEYSWLVQQPNSSVNMFYLSGRHLNKENIPTMVEMVMVSETHPSERFKKLITKGHFEEAEEFGKQFELCLHPIYEAKAKHILIDLVALSDNNSKIVDQRFNDLLRLLEKIESKDFFRKHRMVAMPTRKMLKIYLEEVLRHLDQEDDERDTLEISEQLRRLDTLSIIDPYDCNMEWQKFIYHSNLLKMIAGLLKNDVLTASLIWKRHASAMMRDNHLNEMELCRLLNLIPHNTEAFQLVQWLRHFVPTVSNTHPSMMPFVTDFCIQKSRDLQYSKHWPEIGLEFSTKIMEIFGVIQFTQSHVCRQHERNLAKICDLVSALEDLSVLKNSFNLTLTLDNYLHDSIDDSALCILQHVHLSKINRLINDFLYPIFQEKGLSPATAIKRYISLLVGNRKVLSSWLERSVACIGLLHNEDDRLECALLVLKNSPVPWPETTIPLIKLCFSTHPLAVELKTEYEIQVVKVMKMKYGWPAESQNDLEMLMFRIVKMDLPDMLEDIHTLKTTAPDMAFSINFNFCYQMVVRGKIESAVEFFKKIKLKNKTQLIQSFDLLVENMVFQTDDCNVEEQMYLIEFHKLISSYSRHKSAKGLEAIEHRFILRHKFGLPVHSVCDLSDSERCRSLFEEGVANIIERNRATMNVPKIILTKMGELCRALGMDKCYGVYRLSQRMQCLPLTCALAQGIFETSECSVDNREYYIDLALELLRQQMILIRSCQQISLSSVSNFFTEYDPVAYPLMYRLLVTASMYEQERSSELIELLKFVSIARNTYAVDVVESHYSGREIEVNEEISKALKGSQIAMPDTVLNYSIGLNSSDPKPPVNPKKRYSVSVFDEIDVQPLNATNSQPMKAVGSKSNDQMLVVKFVTYSLLLMVSLAEPRNCFLRKLRDSLDNEIISDVHIIRADFFRSMEQLIKAKVHDVWYLMAQYLIEYQTLNNFQLISRSFVSQQMLRMFRNMMSVKDVDFTDLLTMLIANEQSSTLLERLDGELKTDQQKMNLLTLTESYNAFRGATDSIAATHTKRIKHFYYMEFCKEDSSIKGKFNAEIDDIEQLLKELHNKKLNVQLLERMSRDFSFDYQHMLVSQVVRILHDQELQYEIKMDAFGEEELVMISSEDSIHNLCKPFINEIRNTEMLITRLQQFIGEINIYFYELYLCVIDILNLFNAVPEVMQVWRNILVFLKHKMIKRRRNRPGQQEIDMWMQFLPEVGVLPNISRYRVPFKPIVEQPLKETLDNELSVENCESWFPLIEMYSMLNATSDVNKMRDYFCMSVVKNSIAEYKAKNDGGTEVWHLQPTNNAFLKSVLRLVRHVVNPSKAFLILYFVSNYAPDGADQVEASYECYKYVMDHEDLIVDTKLLDKVAKIKRKYPTLKTQHLLHVYGLTEEKLMRLVENPTALINSLYHHDSILKTTSKININAVVQEISKLHGLDVEAIQFQLLQKWLSFSNDLADGSAFEETFFEDEHMTNNPTDDAGNAAENVVRANYILNSWPKKEAIHFLVAHIFPADGSANTSKQLQMYECFSKLNDGSPPFHNILSQRDYITLKCVHDLNRLGYKTSPEKFAKCDKIDILKVIWQRNAHNPYTLEILANVCLGFDIHLPKIWNGILKRMVMFRMVRELNALVDVLSCHAKLLNTEGLTAAWEFVLQQPFIDAKEIRSFAQEDVLQKTLFRLQGCPVLHNLNLVEFAQLCLLLDRPYMGAVIMAFGKEEQRQEIKTMIVNCKSEKLRKDILDLGEAGILPTILNFSLKELDL